LLPIKELSLALKLDDRIPVAAILVTSGIITFLFSLPGKQD
jgi:hypothetical protein